MTVLRIITDINVKEYPSTEQIGQVTEALKTYATGVITTLQMTGDEPVSDRGGHIHISTEDELCQTCRQYSRDEIS